MRSFVRALGRLCRLSSFLALFAPAYAGNVLVVDPGGGGAFTQIQPAIDAAGEGDTILVKAGTYTSFVVGNKSLSIVGDTGANVLVTGAIRVRNLAKGKTLVLARLKSTSIADDSSVVPYGLYVFNNLGSVRLEACEFTGADGDRTIAHPDGWDGAFVSTSPDIAFTRCTMRGGLGRLGHLGYTDAPGTAGAGLAVSDSTASLYGCTLLGGQGEDGIHGGCCEWDGGSGGDGCNSLSSTLLLSGCTLIGGDGGDAYVQFCAGLLFGGAAGSALHLLASPGNLARVQGCTEAGGTPGCDIGGLCNTYCYPQYGPRSGSTIVDLPSPARKMLSPTPVRENTAPVLSFQGQSGDRVNLFLSGHLQSVFVPSWEGMLLVRPRMPHMMMILGTVPASGTLNVQFPISALGAGVQSIVTYMQAVFIDAQGNKRLSNPGSLVVLDSAF